MIRAPRSCTRTDHIFPCTTLFRSIDFFLPGLSYPRRRIILEALHARGYHVRSSDLTLPAYIYRSLMGRSKAIIDINRFEGATHMRSEEHTSELQSLMRISYAVFCLNTNTQQNTSYT